MKKCFLTSVVLVLLSLLQEVEAFNASTFVGFFFLAIFVIGGLIFLVLCCKDRKYIFGTHRPDQPTAITVAIPNEQQSARVPPQQLEFYPQFSMTAFPECTTPLQVQLETAHSSYVGEPPPPYPGN
ncbi:uncharacterized protein LOC144654472 [Oculina patagonica]